jgi:hypothetical protein
MELNGRWRRSFGAQATRPVRKWTAIALHSSPADVTGWPQRPSVVVTSWKAFGGKAGACFFSRGAGGDCQSNWIRAKRRGGRVEGRVKRCSRAGTWNRGRGRVQVFSAGPRGVAEKMALSSRRAYGIGARREGEERPGSGKEKASNRTLAVCWESRRAG